VISLVNPLNLYIGMAPAKLLAQQVHLFKPPFLETNTAISNVQEANIITTLTEFAEMIAMLLIRPESRIMLKNIAICSPLIVSHALIIIIGIIHVTQPALLL